VIEEPRSGCRAKIGGPGIRRIRYPHIAARADRELSLRLDAAYARLRDVDGHERHRIELDEVVGVDAEPGYGRARRTELRRRACVECRCVLRLQRRIACEWKVAVVQIGRAKRSRIVGAER